jgi:predicted RNase H-like HicB family nuclease
MKMKGEFTAIIETAPEGGFWTICPEVPGANGQGETIEETKNSLREAIELILDDRKADIIRGLPEDAIQEKVLIEGKIILGGPNVSNEFSHKWSQKWSL